MTPDYREQSAARCADALLRGHEIGERERDLYQCCSCSLSVSLHYEIPFGQKRGRFHGCDGAAIAARIIARRAHSAPDGDAA